MTIGTVGAIWRYPVKSLAAQPLERADVSTSGLAGDRERALWVRTGHARAGKTYRGKENDRLHLARDGAAALGVAAAAGVDAELRDGERFFDAAPVSVLVDRWLRELGEYVGYAVEPLRFRPNLFVRAEPSFEQGEAQLVGAELMVGSVRLRVREPIERCVVTTYDPKGGDADPRILRFVAQSRNTWMGVYCDVLEPGTLALGDTLSRLPGA
ncbi:MAG TPA: MOSC domain-containing protein [Candidatus Acidoferrales bacterium]|nr:MOSC domain-containing protein [Candidatus Acidoferrales bacterium]